MSGGNDMGVILNPKMEFCDSWLEKKVWLYHILYKLGFIRNYGLSGHSCGNRGVWTYVWRN